MEIHVSDFYDTQDGRLALRPDVRQRVVSTIRQNNGLVEQYENVYRNLSSVVATQKELAGSLSRDSIEAIIDRAQLDHFDKVPRDFKGRRKEARDIRGRTAHRLYALERDRQELLDRYYDLNGRYEEVHPLARSAELLLKSQGFPEAEGRLVVSLAVTGRVPDDILHQNIPTTTKEDDVIYKNNPFVLPRTDLISNMKDTEVRVVH